MLAQGRRRGKRINSHVARPYSQVNPCLSYFRNGTVFHGCLFDNACCIDVFGVRKTHARQKISASQDEPFLYLSGDFCNWE